MHKKFIALIVATAVTITGVSASKARLLTDAMDILGGLAAIAIIGAGVHYYNQGKAQGTDDTPSDLYASALRGSAQTTRCARLPQHVARYDLPQQCLRTFNAYSNNQPAAGPEMPEETLQTCQ